MGRVRARGWCFWTEGLFIERMMEGWKRGTRQGQGDGRSLGTEELPISQLPLLNTGITEEEETEDVHRCGLLLSPTSLSFVFILCNSLKKYIFSLNSFFLNFPS